MANNIRVTMEVYSGLERLRSDLGFSNLNDLLVHVFGLERPHSFLDPSNVRQARILRGSGVPLP